MRWLVLACFLLAGCTPMTQGNGTVATVDSVQVVYKWAESEYGTPPVYYEFQVSTGREHISVRNKKQLYVSNRVPLMVRVRGVDKNGAIGPWSEWSDWFVGTTTGATND